MKSATPWNVLKEASRRYFQTRWRMRPSMVVKHLAGWLSLLARNENPGSMGRGRGTLTGTVSEL